MLFTVFNHEIRLFSSLLLLLVLSECRVTRAVDQQNAESCIYCNSYVEVS